MTLWEQDPLPPVSLWWAFPLLGMKTTLPLAVVLGLHPILHSPSSQTRAFKLLPPLRTSSLSALMRKRTPCPFRLRRRIGQSRSEITPTLRALLTSMMSLPGSLQKQLRNSTLTGMLQRNLPGGILPVQGESYLFSQTSTSMW